MQRARPFRRVNRPAPFQNDLHAKMEPIRRVLERGIIIDSPDIGARQLPNGQTELYLKRFTQPTPAAAATTPPPVPILPAATHTEFYCKSGGSNINGGGLSTGLEPSTTAVYTCTNSNWNGTSIFTPTDGSTPANSVTVGDFASIYIDGATVAVYIARVTAVAAGVNGAITVSTTARAGSPPASSATGRSIKVGGAWKGPNAASGFPFTLTGVANLGSATNAAGDVVRVNLKNDATYSITANIGCTAAEVVYQGYTSTPGDLGRAQIDGGTSNITLVSGGVGNKFYDLIFANNGPAGFAALSLTTGCAAVRCVAHDVTQNGFYLSNAGPCALIECEAYACNKGNVVNIGVIDFQGGAQQIIHRCYVHDCPGSNVNGIRGQAGNGCLQIANSIFDTIGGNAISIAHSAVSNQIAVITNCDFYNNGGSGIFLEGTNMRAWVFVENCNFIKNGAYGFNGNTFTSLFGFMLNNAFGSGTMANSSGDTHNIGNVIQAGAITYAAGTTPYNSASTGDFSIVQDSAKGLGRGQFTETKTGKSGTVGYPDIGAAQAI